MSLYKVAACSSDIMQATGSGEKQICSATLNYKERSNSFASQYIGLKNFLKSIH